MPLLKIHVEQDLWSSRKEPLLASLKPIRAMLCDRFKVDLSAAQLAIIPVFGVDDQAPVAVEMRILPKPERTHEVILGACEDLRARLSEASGARVVVRCQQIDPATYLTLK